MIKYYKYVLRSNLLSYRMLTVWMIMIMTMDAFTKSVREIYIANEMLVSPFCFVHLWNNKYNILSFMLLFIYSVANNPRDRIKERYIIARIGLKKWIWGQILYLLTFSWFYLVSLIVINTLFMLPCTKWENAWGSEWSILLDKKLLIDQDIMIFPTTHILTNYEPLEAFITVFVIGGCILMMLSFLVIVMNSFYKMLGSFLGTGLVVFSVSATYFTQLIRFSPVSWWKLDMHYSITRQELPSISYMLLVLILLIILCINVFSTRVIHTQEDYTIGGNKGGK